MDNSKRNHLLALFLALCVGVGGLTVAGCSTGTEASETSGSDQAEVDDAVEEEQRAVPVEVARLEGGSIESVLRYSANLEAERAVTVLSQSARLVRDLRVEEGDRVDRGQVLLRLQDDEQRTELAKVQSQLDRAEREYERQKRLFEDQLISEQDFNQATYDLEQLELSLEEAERQLSYTEVRAPISGTITSRMVNLGDYVTVNQPLFEMVDFDSLVARVYVPEKELPRLDTGLPARITAPALNGEEYSGRVDRLSPVVDPRSGTVKVTVAVPRASGLRPGLYVDVALVTDVREDVILVPKRALVYDRDQVFVYRLADDEKTVERLELEATLENETHVLPAAPLERGTRLVVAGQAGLKDGAEVRLLDIEPLASVAETNQAADANQDAANEADR